MQGKSTKQMLSAVNKIKKWKHCKKKNDYLSSEL